MLEKRVSNRHIFRQEKGHGGVRRGFLLVEIVVALGLITVCGALIARYQRLSWQLTHESIRRTKALDKRLGYTLLELVVYLSLSVILSMVLGRIAMQLYQYSLFSHKAIHVMNERSLCFDVMRRDLMSASGAREKWDMHACVFEMCLIDGDQIVTVHVGFAIKNGRVLRYEGEYDFIHHCWVKRCASVLCEGVSSLQWEYEMQDDMVRGVWVTYDSNKKYMRLRNGFV
jgi:type II secretory pathway component PulJ